MYACMHVCMDAVLGLLFFSPSAATLCRGILAPNLWLSWSVCRPARVHAGPGPGPGPAGGRAWLLPICSHLPVEVGSPAPGRRWAEPGRGPGTGPGPGQEPACTSRGSTSWPEGAAAELPDFGMPGSTRTVLTRAGRYVAVSASCVGVAVTAASTPSRGSLGALCDARSSAALHGRAAACEPEPASVRVG
jgi:hypothetical protein